MSVGVPGLPPKAKFPAKRVRCTPEVMLRELLVDNRIFRRTLKLAIQFAILVPIALAVEVQRLDDRLWHHPSLI
jgi:hypothetical protein